ncbi:MAG: heavy metal-binding domain-containing protein [Bacteroidales bacterium]|nr:heavy metal-binding domain-containing protein [Bacteroidales bacterium]
MILTTTHLIPGYSIDKYKGLVNANQVIGVNIISEWIASITDVIGGTSGTFRRKLDTVYSDVLSALSTKAKELGANAIVGVKMDFDEISANGKSMFMLTAQGTAVEVSIDRFMLYKRLHELKVYLEDGLLSQEEYERECNHVRSSMDDMIAEETKQIAIEKLRQEQAMREAEEKLLQIQQKLAMKNEKISSIDKNIKEYKGFHLGEIVEVIDTGEYVCIDGFTITGYVVCIKGDEVEAYPIDEIQHGNL